MLDATPANRPDETIDADRLVVILQHQEENAVGIGEDELGAAQDENMERYLGLPYGDEREGASSVVATDAAEVVDWALGDLLEPFFAGDDVVKFEPVRPGDEQFCKQATDYCNHIWTAENDGDLVLHDFVKTALIQRNGILKTTWVDEDEEVEEPFTGLSLQQVMALREEDGVELLSVEAMPAAVSDPAMQPAFADGMMYAGTLSRQKRTGCVRLFNIPPEQFRVSKRATSLERAPYCAHVEEKTKAELVDMGFDEELVRGARSNSSGEDDENDRSDIRFFDEDEGDDALSAEGAWLNQTVNLAEEYIRLDGQLLQCFRVGKTLLEEPTPVEEVPFDSWTPDRIPNRLNGQALVDKVKQTQRIKTGLQRQMLDNLTLSNRPRIELPNQAIGENTITDLLSYQIGGLVRTEVGGMINPMVVPDTSSTALQGITYFDQVREAQSGITRNGMAVSSEAIDPKSATESRRQDRNEQVRKKLMIRLLAQTFLVPVFRKILRNVVQYQDFTRSIMVGEQWQEIDPRSWHAELRAHATVGLGYTNREEDLSAAQIVMGAQAQGIQTGMVQPEHLYQTFTKLVEAVGWRWPQKYALDPSSPEGQQKRQEREQQQQQPDAKQQELQMKMQLKMQEMQMDAKRDELKAQRDIQIEMMKAQAKQAIERERYDFDYKAQLREIEQDYQLGIQRLEAEITLKERQMAAELQLKREQMALQASMQQASRPIRLGGAVG